MILWPQIPVFGEQKFGFLETAEFLQGTAYHYPLLT